MSGGPERDAEAGRDTRIGRFAIEQGHVSREQLDEILREQADRRDEAKRLGRMMVEREWIDEHDLEMLLRAQQLERVREALDGFEILELVGGGSMGVVYRAVQKSLDRTVAIKVLAPRFASKRGYVSWFLNEARTVALLNHPNIIAGIDSGEAAGYPYYVMEYVDGPSVAELVRRGGPMDESRAVDFTMQVAYALDYAHRNGYVHRDVKPHNILVAGGVAKLCDLGLARSQEERERISGILGTPDYISPEQVRGEDAIDIRADIYSLGMSLYTMLTGEPPFRGPTRAAVMAAHLSRNVPDLETRRPGLLESTESVFHRMTAKRPRDRFANPSELIPELQLCMSELALRESDRTPTAPVRRRRRRR